MDKKDVKLRCLNFAIEILGGQSSAITKGESSNKTKPSVEAVLLEAKKIYDWVNG